jgi:hypothetical protein
VAVAAGFAGVFVGFSSDFVHAVARDSSNANSTHTTKNLRFFIVGPLEI